MATAPVFAQTQVCSKVATINVAAGGTGTILAASNQQVDICGFLVTGYVAATGFQLSAGTTNLTPILVMPVSGSIAWPYEVPTFSIPTGVAVTVSCTTGTCTGFLTYR